MKDDRARRAARGEPEDPVRAGAEDGARTAEDPRPLNLAGAWVLAAAEEVQAAAEAVTMAGGAVPAALVALAHRQGQSIEELRHTLRLSHSGTVRLVDRMVDRGWAARRASRDGRTVALELTRSGHEQARRILASRQTTLARLLAPLEPDERDQLAGLLEKLLTAHTRDRAHASVVCRLCDRSRCAPCPVREVALGS
jgi:MarR family transcriptional regulator, negative regulator of the multidrug operon emrRAB